MASDADKGAGSVERVLVNVNVAVVLALKHHV